MGSVARRPGDRGQSHLHSSWLYLQGTPHPGCRGRRYRDYHPLQEGTQMTIFRSAEITHPGVRKAIQDFEDMRGRMHYFGAGDSEPDAVFQWIIAQAILDTGQTL